MQESFFKKQNGIRGMSLIETVIYISILAMLVFTITSVLFLVSRSYKKIQAAELVESTAMISLDRMVREIRDASSIDTAGSLFNISPGVLVLNTTDENDLATTIKFLVVGDRVRVVEGGIDVGPISKTRARVTSLVFQPIMSPQSKAVRIKMIVETGQGESYLSKPFYSTTVLRGSYLP